MGRFSAQRHLHVTVGVLYWHFVDVVWLAVFTTLLYHAAAGVRLMARKETSEPRIPPRIARPLACPTCCTG